MNKYASEYPLTLMASVLKVSVSGYFAWRARAAFAVPEARLAQTIEPVSLQNRRTYGYRRIYVALQNQGLRVGWHRIRRTLRHMGHRTVYHRRMKLCTTDSPHRLPVADNLLGQQFKAYAPGQVWVTDITYLPAEKGFVYLAAVKDGA